MRGWIRLHRQILDWQWYQDHKVFRVFMHLLLTARYEDGHSLGVPVRRGQAITGRKKLSSETGLTEKEVRTALGKLEETGEIVKKTANKFSLITICKYEEYQEWPSGKGPAKGQQGASKGPLTNKGKKGNKTTSPENDPRFMEFWKKYPKKVNQPTAHKAWEKHGCGNGIFTEVMDGLRRYLRGPWQGKDLQYVPNPSSWLNGKRWNDEIDPPKEDEGWT